MLEALREDFKHLPELLEGGAALSPRRTSTTPTTRPGGGSAEPVAAPQLGLFG